MMNSGQNKLVIPNNTSDLYAVFVNSEGEWFNTSTNALESYSAGNYANYAVAGVAEGPLHLITVPDDLPQGRYAVTFSSGSSPATSDDPIASLQLEISITRAGIVLH